MGTIQGKYLIPVISFLVVVIFAFVMQTYDMSWSNFLYWFGFVSLCIGTLEVLAGLILLFTSFKNQGRQLLITGLVLLLIVVITFFYSLSSINIC